MIHAGAVDADAEDEDEDVDLGFMTSVSFLLAYLSMEGGGRESKNM